MIAQGSISLFVMVVDLGAERHRSSILRALSTSVNRSQQGPILTRIEASAALS
jgi:hypothetical protein